MSHVAPSSSGATPAPSRGSGAPAAAEGPSIGQLVAEASRDVSSLLRNEIALAKSEVKVSVKAGGVALGLFAAAAFLLVLAVIMLSVGLAYLINLTGLGLAWCFLLVFLLYTLLAAGLGFLGYRRVQKVRPPRKAIAQAQETKALFTR